MQASSSTRDIISRASTKNGQNKKKISNYPRKKENRNDGRYSLSFVGNLFQYPVTTMTNTGDNEDTIIKKIAPELEEFYASHNIQLSSLLQTSNNQEGYRFVRLNPRYDKKETLELLRKELDHKFEPLMIPWLDPVWNFYALPQTFGLASSKSFKSGRVYGMDVSSGAAIAALLSKTYDKIRSNNEPIMQEKLSNETRVLDLCCCPGLKLCAMADFLRNKTATVVGVDVSESRMNLCKKIVSKYHIDTDTCGTIGALDAMKIQLYCQDGTSFGMNSNHISLVYDSRSAAEELAVRGKRKRMNKSARTRERKRLKMLASTDWQSNHQKTGLQEQSPRIKLFDYVLVDAECSTDGSLKHMKERLKDRQTNGEEKNTLLTDQTQLRDLVDLQKRLIASGFRLLKHGGTLVYSTCSLSHDQNEKVIQWLLKTEPNSFLIPVHFPLAKSKLVVEGSLPGTVRFYPNLCCESQTEIYGDGFFLAKLGKR